MDKFKMQNMFYSIKLSIVLYREKILGQIFDKKIFGTKISLAAVSILGTSCITQLYCTLLSFSLATSNFSPLSLAR